MVDVAENGRCGRLSGVSGGLFQRDFGNISLRRCELRPERRGDILRHSLAGTEEKLKHIPSKGKNRA